MNSPPFTFNLPEVSIDSLLWNLLIGIALSIILGLHFNHRAKSRVLRRDLGLVLPVICLTTLLVISVVKSSLALSLGLVGALSIVRFRTPIKEPEELAYIFLSIAIGLALGADQREVAAIAMPVILVLISIVDRWRSSKPNGSGNVILSIEISKDKAQVDEILNMMEAGPTNLNVRRIDQDEKNLSITALVNFPEKEALTSFCKDFQSKFPEGRFSILDDFSFPNE
jgi:uncharacterized membrane protein YhiD involved in acid resistance